MTRRVLFYVQNLLGVGHLQRAATLARAMAGVGLDVHVTAGCPPGLSAEFEVAQPIPLPSVRAADASFKILLDEDGSSIDSAWKVRRRRALLDAFDQLQPDVLIIELFPFGRRQFRFELLPLIERARPNSTVVCSVRDVLVRRDDPARNREVIETANQWFDRILVHGDPQLIPLTESFPDAASLDHMTDYTGYVVDEREPSVPAELGKGEVIVSVGGGAVGEALLRTALAARRLSRMASVKWRLLVGSNIPEQVFSELVTAAPDGVIVESARNDFRGVLRNAALSVSQGGYNTVMDLLSAQCRSVIVPFSAAGESEQSERARVLQDRGLITMVEESDLNPETLSQAIDKALDAPKPSAQKLNLSGAATTAQIITGL